jgi:hypothetical protein
MCLCSQPPCTLSNRKEQKTMKLAKTFRALSPFRKPYWNFVRHAPRQSSGCGERYTRGRNRNQRFYSTINPLASSQYIHRYVDRILTGPFDSELTTVLSACLQLFQHRDSLYRYFATIRITTHVLTFLWTPAHRRVPHLCFGYPRPSYRPHQLDVAYNSLMKVT